MTVNIYPQPTDLPPGSQAFARETIRRIEELQRNRESDSSDQNATNKGLAASMVQLSKQLNAMPVTVTFGATASPTSANSSAWVTKASATIVVPAGKSTCSIIATGNLMLLDTVSGGVAAPPNARFLINGIALPLGGGIPATKDSGASQVNNVVSLSATTTLNVTNLSSFTVEMQASVFHATAYASPSGGNAATFGGTAIFS